MVSERGNQLLFTHRTNLISIWVVINRPCSERRLDEHRPMKISAYIHYIMTHAERLLCKSEIAHRTDTLERRIRLTPYAFS